MKEDFQSSAKIDRNASYSLPVAPSNSSNNSFTALTGKSIDSGGISSQDVNSAKIIASDQSSTDLTVATELGFPWSSAKYGEKAIGTLFASSFTNQEIEDFYERTQLGSIIIDVPVEDSFSNGFKVILLRVENAEATEEQRKAFDINAQLIYKKDKTKIIRFFKLSRLYGRSFLIIGYHDNRSYWAGYRPAPGTKIDWIQPTPEPNVQEVKTSNNLPLKIESLRVSFGTDSQTINPTRFLFTMNPKITREDKAGISALAPVINLLTVQIHADWAIGQSLWRNASKLYALQAPRKTMTPTEKLEALAGTANINSRTVVYLPHMWGMKEISGTGGNVAISRTYRTLVEQISAGCRIPVSILLGTQKSGLASDDDMTNYYRFLGTLQENTYAPQLHEYFRHRQKAGDLSPGEFTIVFNELESRSPKAKLMDDLEELAIKRLSEILNDPNLLRESGLKAVDLMKIIKK
jgi:hypothetical protein